MECHKEIEEDFKRVADFLRNVHHHGATIDEVSESTEVSKKRIKDFIRNDHLYAVDYPNLGYPCSRCGKVIKKEDLCTECSNEFSAELNNSLEADKGIKQMSTKTTTVSNKYWKLRK
ncbi:putative flagellar protein [Planococcus sp. PAMC 21323]|nr:putative flagellar protein [Planococcus sp. PAMC 21323]